MSGRPAKTTSGGSTVGGGTADLRERHLTDTVTRLQRGVLRLAFSFHGANPELDRLLKQLGTLIRGGRKDGELDQLIDTTINLVVKIACESRAATDSAAALRELMSRLTPPLTHAAEFTTLASRAEAAPTAELPALIADCAATINRVLREDRVRGSAGEPPAAHALPAQLRRLLGAVDLPPGLRPAYQALQTRLQELAATEDVGAAVHATAELLNQALAQAAAAPAAESAPPYPAIRDTLLSLLEHLSIPEDMFARAARIRADLEPASTGTAIARAVDAIVELVADMKQRLQREINTLAEFLQQITRRLADLEVHIGLARGLHGRRNEDCSSLQQVIDASIGGIRQSMHECQDLDSLRHNIDARLLAINERFSEFVAAETERHAATEQAMDLLSGELSELETETRQLRSDLEQQHVRAMVDPLTGIPNRLGYDDRINTEFARWRRYGGKLSLAVVDVDLFKQINDTYGHVAGDKVLATVAEQLRARIRESDHLCRFGGEEFILILPETDLAAAAVVVDKLREAIEHCRFHYKQTPVPVTVSCGIAEFGAGDTIAAVFERADEAMYLAKQRGRNRCIVDGQAA